MRRSRLATLAACGLLVAACGTGARSGGLGGPGSGVQGRQSPAGEPRHPGEHDPARSAAATAAFGACGRAAGWDFQDLALNVSDRGLLIGVRYRAVRRTPDAPGRDETVRRCLDEAGVDQP